MSRKQQGPCAACKLLRRRCVQDCTFAPYFPSNEPNKFANVHRVFGASNVSKMLQELPVHLRDDTVSSMAYEASTRVSNPVYGCAGTIASLQHQVETLQAQLAKAQAEVVHLQLMYKSCLAVHGGPPVESRSSSVPSSPNPMDPNAESLFNDVSSELIWSC